MEGQKRGEKEGERRRRKRGGDTDKGAEQKETEQEKESKENCQTCIFNSSYHFQIPLTPSLNHSALSIFLLSSPF